MNESSLVGRRTGTCDRTGWAAAPGGMTNCELAMPSVIASRSGGVEARMRPTLERSVVATPLGV